MLSRALMFCLTSAGYYKKVYTLLGKGVQQTPERCTPKFRKGYTFLYCPPHDWQFTYARETKHERSCGNLCNGDGVFYNSGIHRRVECRPVENTMNPESWCVSNFRGSLSKFLHRSAKTTSLFCQNAVCISSRYLSCVLAEMCLLYLASGFSIPFYTIIGSTGTSC